MRMPNKKAFDVTGSQETAGRGMFQEVWRRLRKSRTGMAGLIILGIMTVLGILTIIIDLCTSNAVYDAYVISQNLTLRFAAPSWQHLLGCDELGRDMLFRCIWGIRYSLFLGALCVMIAAVIGVLLGTLSAYYSKIADNAIMRCMDILMAMPQMLLVIAIVAALGTNLRNLVMAISISYIPTFARLSRASTLTVKDKEFIEAMRAMGASDAGIIVHHIMPNAMAPAIVQGSLGIAYAILALAGMSFLGLGIQPPTPEWGSMIAAVRNYMRQSWHLTVVPGMFIILSVLSLNMLGDGLRDALDPSLKN